MQKVFYTLYIKAKKPARNFFCRFVVSGFRCKQQRKKFNWNLIWILLRNSQKRFLGKAFISWYFEWILLILRLNKDKILVSWILRQEKAAKFFHKEFQLTSFYCTRSWKSPTTPHRHNNWATIKLPSALSCEIWEISKNQFSFTKSN